MTMDPVLGEQLHRELASPCTYLRLRNDLYCVEWGVKLYSLTLAPMVGRGPTSEIQHSVQLRLEYGLWNY